MSSLTRTTARAIARAHGNLKPKHRRRPNHAAGRMRAVAPKKGWMPQWLREMLQGGREAAE
jgi:hypothetical protein